MSIGMLRRHRNYKELEMPMEDREPVEEKDPAQEKVSGPVTPDLKAERQKARARG